MGIYFVRQNRNSVVTNTDECVFRWTLYRNVAQSDSTSIRHLWLCCICKLYFKWSLPPLGRMYILHWRTTHTEQRNMPNAPVPLRWAVHHSFSFCVLYTFVCVVHSWMVDVERRSFTAFPPHRCVWRSFARPRPKEVKKGTFNGFIENNCVHDCNEYTETFVQIWVARKYDVYVVGWMYEHE